MRGTMETMSTAETTGTAPTIASTWVGESGPVVVFLHGLFGRGRNFTRAAKDLLPQRRSLLVDLPDHGGSGWTEQVDYLAMADAVAATIREQAGDALPVDLLGHSMGGKVAMVLALRHPELVRRLVVADISPTRREGSGEFEHLLGSLAALDLSALTSRNEADAQLREKIPSPTVRGFLLQNLRPQGRGGFAWGANLEVLRRDLPRIADFPDMSGRTFEGPVLWIAGEASDYVLPEHLPAMRALFPRVRKLTLKGAGHWVHSERPEEFAEVLRIFLDGQ